MRESEIVKLCVKISNMIYGRDFTHAQSNDSEIMSFTGQRLTYSELVWIPSRMARRFKIIQQGEKFECNDWLHFSWLIIQDHFAPPAGRGQVNQTVRTSSYNQS